MIKVIRFAGSGPGLSVSLEFKGAFVASYGLKLSEKDSNAAVEHWDGDNVNPDDDVYKLPGPASAQDGRVLRLTTDFYGLDPVNVPDYSIKMQVLQGGQALGDQMETGTLQAGPSGQGRTQTSLLFLKLSA